MSASRGKLLLALILALLGLGAPARAAAPEGNTVFEKLRPLVFQIKTAISADAPKVSYGTGFVVDAGGLLITNFHVVADAVLDPKRYKVYLTQDSASVPAEILQIDVVNDLALLSVSQAFPSAVAISPAMPAQGAPIFSLGMPEDLNKSIVEGIYNGVLNEGPFSKIHMSSPINPGMSGGPTVDAAGRLVGVNVSKLVQSSNISFSVPKIHVEALLARARGKTPPDTAALESSIRDQILSTGKEIVSELVSSGKKTRDFSGWSVPELPEQFRCWSNRTKIEKASHYVTTSEVCGLHNNIHLRRDLSSGEFSLDMKSYERTNLNGAQFFTLVSNGLGNGKKSQLSSQLSKKTMPEYTAPVCETERVDNPHGVPMVVHACLRAMTRFGGVYEGGFDLMTLYTGKKNLVVGANVSGVSFEDFHAFLAHFSDGIAAPTAAKGSNAAN